jgi:hypothetical protein
MLGIFFSVLAQIGGAMLVALLGCVVSWNLLKLVRHPEYGPWLAGAAVVLLILIGVRTILPLRLTAFFILIAAPLLWLGGDEWRKRHPSH